MTQAAAAPAAEVLRTLGSHQGGLSEHEVLRRRAAVGPNAVRSHHARPWAVLGRQLASPRIGDQWHPVEDFRPDPARQRLRHRKGRSGPMHVGPPVERSAT